MSYLVRSIKVDFWPDGVNTIFTDIKYIKADAITHDLKTEDNKISLWKIDKLEELESMAVSIASVYKSKGLIKVIAIPYTEIESCLELENSSGKTAVLEYRKNHYDVKNLTYNSIGTLAEIVSRNIQNKDYVKGLTFNDLKKEIELLNVQGKIDQNMLGEVYKL